MRSLNSIVGRKIIAVRNYDEPGHEQHPVLTLDNGDEVTFEGVGYDGLWTSVVYDIKEGSDA